MKTVIRNIILVIGIPIAVVVGFLLLPLLFIFMIIILLLSGGTIYKISNAKSKYRNFNDREKDDDAIDVNYEVIDEENKKIGKE